jgi:hypothetical protein
MMVTDATRCAHCDSPIVDPTAQVVHGSMTFCCPNCAAAMEQSGSGSDPHAGRYENELHCAHCGCAIVDEATMQTKGDDAFCCVNCARAMAAAAS